MEKEVSRLVTRVSGAKNTFFIVNTFDPLWTRYFEKMKDSEKREVARHLCQNFFGFHTDGILFIKPEKKWDFGWDFYNSDGSTLGPEVETVFGNRAGAS